MNAPVELVDTIRTHVFPNGSIGHPGGLPNSEEAERHFIDAWLGGLKRINELLIGQALTCKQHEIIAVEAIEGTDRLIERTGQFCKRKGWVLCKAANPQQDMRFDVPVVGPKTIEVMRRSNATALAVDAGKKLLFDRDHLIQAADDFSIAIQAFAPAKSVATASPVLEARRKS